MATSQIEPTATAIVAKNSLYQLLGKGIMVALSMGTFALIARSLSVEQYGSFTLISTIFAVVIGLTDLRIDQISVREAAQQPQKLASYAGQSIIVKTIFALFILLISLLVIYFSSYSSVIKIGSLVVFSGVLIGAWQSGFSVIIQHQLKPYLLTLAEVVAKIVCTALVVLVAWQAWQTGPTSDLPIYAYAVITLVISPLLILLSYIYITQARMQIGLNWRLDWSAARQLLGQSWPLWVMSLLAMVHYRADTLLLSLLKPVYDVGIYGLPYRLLDVAITLPPLLIISIYPILSRYVLTDKPRADRALIKSFNALLILVGLLVTIIFYAAPQFVSLFGGVGYGDSVTVLRWLCLAMIGGYLSSVFVPYIIAIRQQWLIVLTLGLSVLLNLGLCWWLIPQFSYYGAAMATASSEMFNFVALLGLALFHYRLRLVSWVPVKVLAAAGGAYGLLWLTHLAGVSTTDFVTNAGLLIVISLVGGGTYLLLLLLMRTLAPDVMSEIISPLPLPDKAKRLLAK